MDGETIPEECYDLPEYTDEQIEDLLPPSPKRACLSPSTPRLSEQKIYTLKVKHDARWTKEDYVKICDMLFPDSEKLLVVLEKAVQNPHVHFHGYSPYEVSTFKKKTHKLTQMHYQQDPTHVGYSPGSRPVQGAGISASPLGFQYCTKELPNNNNPIYQIGFTDAELLDLHAKSQQYLQKLKFNIKEEIWKIPGQYLKADPQVVFERTMLMIGLKLREEKKSKTRYTRLDVIDGLLHHPDAPDDLVKYMMMLH